MYNICINIFIINVLPRILNKHISEQCNEFTYTKKKYIVAI